jgi:hypothetical protein
LRATYYKEYDVSHASQPVKKAVNNVFIRVNNQLLDKMSLSRTNFSSSTFVEDVNFSALSKEPHFTPCFYLQMRDEFINIRLLFANILLTKRILINYYRVKAYDTNPGLFDCLYLPHQKEM